MARLVLLHGRSQQHKDALELKKTWINAWAAGLKANGLEVPIADSDIVMPYYGDTLDDLTARRRKSDVAEIILRGDGDDDEQRFLAEVIEETRQAAGITEQQLLDALNQPIIERDMRDKGWVHATVKALEALPGASAATIAIATRDVYKYLKDHAIREQIDTGVTRAILPATPTIILSHSLGTVIAYSILHRQADRSGWQVPLLITLGSPLGVRAIRDELRPIGRPAAIRSWLNARDERDFVALRPLVAPHFKVTPEIENKSDVRNETPNRHGITGYLSDPDVARRVHDALIDD